MLPFAILGHLRQYCVMLCYVALCCVILYYIILNYIILYYIILYYIILYYIILYYITLHYITSHYITLHYIKLYYITLHYIALYYVICESTRHLFYHCDLLTASFKIDLLQLTLLSSQVNSPNRLIFACVKVLKYDRNMRSLIFEYNVSYNTNIVSLKSSA